jgi:hypothetical protein
MKKILPALLMWSCMGFTARAAEVPRTPTEYVFTAKVSDTRQSGVLVELGKKKDEVLTVTYPAAVFKEPREYSLEGKPPRVDEPLLSFVAARQFWKKADDVQYLDFWHSTTHLRIREMMAKAKADGDMAKRLAAARQDAKIVTILGVVKLQQGCLVIVREKGKAAAHFMLQETGRWRLADLLPRSMEDINAAVIEAAFTKGSVTAVVPK